MLRSLVCMVVVLHVLPIAARAGSDGTTAICDQGTTPAYFELRTDNNPACVGAVDGAIEYVTVTLVSVPAQKARFSLPDPSFGTIVDEQWNYSFTGDRIHGMEMDLGGCQAPSVALGRLTVFVPNPISGCATWQIDAGCSIDDCTGVTRPGDAWEFIFKDAGTTCNEPCFQRCTALPPYGLFPADGAKGVPLEVVLSWTDHPETIPGDDQLGCAIRISTAPDCETGQDFSVPCDTKSFAPDFLQPNTKYYWQARWWYWWGSGCSSGDRGTSPIFSFTTWLPMDVDELTWGRVKSLYRE